MRILYLLLLFIGLVAGKASESKRLHIIEKFQFYFYYQIEGILESEGKLDGKRTFAPGCKDCNFDAVWVSLPLFDEGSPLILLKFLKHVIVKNKKEFTLSEPSTSEKEMIAEARRLEGPGYGNNPEKVFVNRKLMPSIPDGVADEYKELYDRTDAWMKEAIGKIDELPDEKKAEAQKLIKASYTANDTVQKMRHAGYLNSQRADALDKFGGKVEFNKIDPKDNGGLESYKSIAWDKIKGKGDMDFYNDLEEYTETRNTDNRNTANHIAAHKQSANLLKCYPEYAVSKDS